jgi:membrane protease YdiL (CAAX protease family)
VAPEAVGAGLDRNRRLTAALVVTFAAAAVAFAIVTVVDGTSDAFEAVVPSALRRLAVPFVLAALAFHVIAAAGLLLVRGGRGGPSPLRPPTKFAGEDLLRGGIAFLLALFARSFVTSARVSGGVEWSDIPIRFDALSAVEVLVLVVLPPILQERLFRGLLLVVLRDRFGAVLGVLGQAAIAGAAATWQAAPGARGVTAIAAFAVAAVFGWFAHTTDDLRPGMLGSAFLGVWTVFGRLGI